MLNLHGKIEVRVGYTFNDGDNEYRAIRPKDCSICFFRNNNFPRYTKLCLVLACLSVERRDSLGVHFVKVGGKQ